MKYTWQAGRAFRRLGNCSDTSDRCIALPEASDRRYAGSERRIALHIHVHIATNGGEKCGLAS